MATSLPVDPLTYMHPASLTFRNVRYGPYMQQRLNVYLNPVRLDGGNPVIVYTHGGGWGSNDKTSTVENTTQKQRILWAYLLDSATYETDAAPFDIVSAEWRMHAYTTIAPNPLNTPYEPTLSGAPSGIGPTSYPAYFPAWIDDGQRAVQFCKDNATRFGFDPDKVVAWGSSAGSALAMVAALAPSRRFMPSEMVASPWDATSSSRVRGVLNYYGEINFDPWYMWCNILGPAFGIVENNVANQRADMERLLLIPAADGTYPQGSEVTPLCKSISAVYRLRANAADNRSVKIHSVYDIAENTTAPVGNYSTVPPYFATGHDYHQFADLEAECVAADVPHSGMVIDASLWGGSVQIAYESSLAGTYTWLQTCVDF